MKLAQAVGRPLSWAKGEMIAVLRKGHGDKLDASALKCDGCVTKKERTGNTIAWLAVWPSVNAPQNPGAFSICSNQSKPISLTMRLEITINLASDVAWSLK